MPQEGAENSVVNGRGGGIVRNPGYHPAALQAAPPRHNHWIGAKSPGNVRPPTHVIRKYVVIDKRATPGQMRQHFKKAPSSLGVARLSMINGL